LIALALAAAASGRARAATGTGDAGSDPSENPSATAAPPLPGSMVGNPVPSRTWGHAPGTPDPLGGTPTIPVFHPGPGNPGGVAPAEALASNVSTAAAASAEAPAPEKAKALDLADARVDFKTIVETHFLKSGADGVLRYASGGRTRRVKLVDVDVASVRKKKDGRYAGRVLVRDAGGGPARALSFTVDLSGDDWRVLSVTEPPAKSAASPAKPRS
jgi:hypothetical protein